MNKFGRSAIKFSIHIFCWLILTAALLLSHPPDWGNGVPAIFWIKQLLVLTLLIGFFYFNFYFLVPRYLAKKNTSGYLLRIIPAIGLGIWINDLVTAAFRLNADIVVHDPSGHSHTFPGYQEGIRNVLICCMILLVIGLGIIISFINRWNQEVQLRQQIEKEKVTAELTILKAQINPHFFFNTLNNIYSFTLTDGDTAREAITNLSKMMRYVLYDSGADHTTLSQEIAFVKEYVALMKLRVSEKTRVTLMATEPLTDLLLAPMILLPFIENAFKHGASSRYEGFIDIVISQTFDTVQLTVINTVPEKGRKRKDDNNGIGIANTTKRLELLYPCRHDLKTGKINETTYQTKLLIWI